MSRFPCLYIPPLCLILVCTSGSLCSRMDQMRTSPRINDDFVKKHLVSDVLKKRLDQIFDTSEVLEVFAKPFEQEALETAGFEVWKASWRTFVFVHPKIPGHVFKFHRSNSTKLDVFKEKLNESVFRRVYYADELRTLITRYKLSYLFVPQKWLYHIPGRFDTYANANFLVVAEAVNPTLEHTLCTISASEVDSLLTFIQRARYHDVDLGNFIVTKVSNDEEGTRTRIAVIDTEFPPVSESKAAFAHRNLANKLAVMTSE